MSRLSLHTKQTISKGVLFCTPFVLFFAAVVCLVLYLNQYLLYSSPLSTYLDLLFRGSQGDGNISVSDTTRIESILQETEIIDGTFETPMFATQWATMNVDGWEERDIPVFYGNSTEVLRAGAAMAQFSRFCGQNGKVVLSAHVNLEFYELEDSAARVENGEEVLITMDTLWGRYVYRAKEVVIFGHLDSKPLLSEEGRESLFIYTCYPRENSLAYKTERIGLKCELVQGATWRDYVAK